MGSRTFLTITAALFALLVAPDAPAQSNNAPPTTYTYTAQTSAPVRRSGDIVAGTVAWSCEGTTCTTRGSWPRPGIPACHALALEIGPIQSYGRPGVMLQAPGLTLCNAGVPRDRIVLTPQTPRAQNQLTPSSAVLITTSELSFVGGTQTSVTERAAPPVQFATEELSFVGGAQTTVTDRNAPPVQITTGEISFVGARQ